MLLRGRDIHRAEGEGLLGVTAAERWLVPGMLQAQAAEGSLQLSPRRWQAHDVYLIRALRVCIGIWGKMQLLGRWACVLGAAR